MSLFDSEGLGEVETATKLSDLCEEIKTINENDYEGNNYYFFCGTIHPSFSLFIPASPKYIVDDEVKKLRSEKESNDDEVKFKAINDCMSVLIGVNNTFQKYSCKGGARLLEQYAKQQSQEYKDFCNDVILYNVFMKVFFNKSMALWDINQIKQMGKYVD